MSSARFPPRSSRIRSRCGCWCRAIRRSPRRSRRPSRCTTTPGSSAARRRSSPARPPVSTSSSSTRRISSTVRAIPIWRPAAATGPTTGSASPRSASVAADIGTGKLAAFRPDVVHCHDWHAGLAPALLHYAEGPAAKSVMTIHNLAFQGNFPPAIFPSLGLPDAAFTVDGLEYYGNVSFMKGGLQLADAVTTVSPSYAAEICTPGRRHGLRRPAARPPRRALRHPQRHRHRRVEPGERRARCRRPIPPPRSAAAPPIAAPSRRPSASSRPTA